MISKIRWLWRQFTGPQITALCTGIYRVVSSINTKLNYLNTLSIATANDSHLTLIGILMGITRPLLTVASDAYFLFTVASGQSEEHGFTAIQFHTGGKFTDLADSEQWWSSQIMPASIYRSILLTTAASKGVPGSAIWLDDILHTINSQDTYTIEVADVEDFRWGNPGDIKVTCGSFAELGTNATIIQAAVAGITNAVLNPTTLVISELSL